MKKIHKTEFATLIFDEEKKRFEQHWNNENDLMTEEDYKNIMLAYQQQLEVHKASTGLVDTRKFGFVITIELQEWIDIVIAPTTTKYMEKIAFVMPDDLIEKLSLEQTMTEKESSKVNTRYFNSIEKAREWLEQ